MRILEIDFMTHKILRTSNPNAAFVKVFKIWKYASFNVYASNTKRGLALSLFGGLLIAIGYVISPDKNNAEVIVPFGMFFLCIGLLMLTVCPRGKQIKKYNLDTDIGYMSYEIHESSEERTSNGKVAAKVLMAGIAGQSFKKGNGFLAGVLAASANGMDTTYLENNTRILITVYTMDVETYKFYASRHSAYHLFESCLFDNEDDVLAYGRMYAEGEKVLPELHGNMRKLEQEKNDAEKIAQHGETFEIRNVAKEEIQDITKEMKKISIMISGIEKYALQQEE